jgi:hypothetical protein
MRPVVLRALQGLLLVLLLALPGHSVREVGTYTWACTVTLAATPVAHCTFTPVEP